MPLSGRSARGRRDLRCKAEQCSVGLSAAKHVAKETATTDKQEVGGVEGRGYYN